MDSQWMDRTRASVAGTRVVVTRIACARQHVAGPMSPAHARKKTLNSLEIQASAHLTITWYHLHFTRTDQDAQTVKWVEFIRFISLLIPVQTSSRAPIRFSNCKLQSPPQSEEFDLLYFYTKWTE